MEYYFRRVHGRRGGTLALLTWLTPPQIHRGQGKLGIVTRKNKRKQGEVALGFVHKKLN